MFDPEGTPIACPQHCLELASNSKTRVTYFQDDPHLSSKLNDIKYVNQAADLNYCIAKNPG